jgi:hypothetical protein
MPLPRSNIETVARANCERQLRDSGTSSGLRRLSAEVDRYWHCVAAELEAGLLGENGEQVCSTDFEAGLAAYRDWRKRHPDYVVPALPGAPRRDI